MSDRWQDMERERQFANEEKPASFDFSNYYQQLPELQKPSFLSEGTQAPGLLKTATKTAETTAPFMATGPGAAVAVGASFASQYMAQKAADERAKRQMLAQIAGQHGQAEQHGYDNLINVYRSALG